MSEAHPSGVPERVRALLVCPRCRGELVDLEAGLLCPTDRLVYPVEQGVPWMVPELARAATAQELAPKGP